MKKDLTIIRADTAASGFDAPGYRLMGKGGI